jgi:putative transposase
MMNSRASTGAFSPWTARSPRLPWEGEKTGPSPVDRGKKGTKRSVVTEGQGLGIGVVTAGANRNDFKLARETLESIAIERPAPTAERPQGMCMDKDYDKKEIKELLKEFGFTAHIRRRGEDPQALKRRAKAKARRWVVERKHSWMNRWRSILIRWCKKAQNQLGMLHLVLGIITWRKYAY